MGDDDEVLTVALSPRTPAPVGKPFDLDRFRGRLALAITGIYGLTILAALLAPYANIWVDSGTDVTKQMLGVLERLLPAESAVVAALMGFYFLEKRDSGL